MSGSIAANIADNVSDTLFIPLYMRSLETRRADGIINDPLACELVDRIDYDFSKYEQVPKNQLGTAIRIQRFDRAVSEFVDAHDNPVVIEVGVGLDTRFQRVYKGKGVFYELDLPEVMDVRKQLLPESENNRYIAGSMFDRSWIDEIKGNHPDAQFIVVAEGVFMYFEEEQIRPLIVRIAESFGPGELHFDVTSPWGAKNSHRHEAVKKTNAVFKWGVRDDRDIEQWVPNLQYLGSTNYFSFNKKRWGMVGVLSRVLPLLRNAFRMAHYEILPNQI